MLSMATPSAKLTEADIQDLSSMIVEFTCRYGSCHKEMDLLAKRFGVPLESTYHEKSSSIKSRAYAFLHCINGDPRLLEVIDYVLQKGFGPKTPDLGAYSNILMKYGFGISDANGQLKLVHVPSGLLEKERKVLRSWIEQQANPKVLSHLSDASQNLSKGRFDYVLDDCRKALEALTTGSVGFSDSLTELVNEKVIFQGDKNQKMDVDLLKVVYHFDSTLGSHAAAMRPKPDIEQAILGLHITESCIYFLLKRLENAKANGKKLKCWA